MFHVEHYVYRLEFYLFLVNNMNLVTYNVIKYEFVLYFAKIILFKIKKLD